MGNPVFGVKLPYKVRCDLPDCRKPVNQVFKINLEGNQIKACSSEHARLGEQRWEEKNNLNIRIGIPNEKPEEFVGDNLQELSEGGE